MLPIISYIIPIYNKEKYIEECLDSILLNNISSEIIIINDGSTDLSLKKSILYSNKYHNIKIINQKNKGVSAARNVGLKMAHGKYIQFVDADDMIMPEMSATLINIAETQKADIVFCSYSNLQYQKNQNIEYILNGKNTSIFDAIENFEILFQHRIFHNIGTKIYHRKVLKDIKFNKAISLYEDISFCLEALLKANKSLFIDNPLYIYRRDSETSLSHNHHDHMLQSVEYYFSTIAKVIKCFNLSKNIFIENKQGVLHNLLLNEYKNGYDNFKKSCKYILSKKFIKELKSLKPKNSFDYLIIHFLFYHKFWLSLYIYLKSSNSLKNIQIKVRKKRLA